MSLFEGPPGNECREAPGGYHADLTGDGTCTYCGINIIYESADERLERAMWQDPAAAEHADEEDRYYDS